MGIFNKNKDFENETNNIDGVENNITTGSKIKNLKINKKALKKWGAIGLSLVLVSTIITSCINNNKEKVEEQEKVENELQELLEEMDKLKQELNIQKEEAEKEETIEDKSILTANTFEPIANDLLASYKEKGLEMDIDYVHSTLYLYNLNNTEIFNMFEDNLNLMAHTNNMIQFHDMLFNHNIQTGIDKFIGTADLAYNDTERQILKKIERLYLETATPIKNQTGDKETVVSLLNNSINTLYSFYKENAKLETENGSFFVQNLGEGSKHAARTYVVYFQLLLTDTQYATSGMANKLMEIQKAIDENNLKDVQLIDQATINSDCNEQSKTK